MTSSDDPGLHTCPQICHDVILRKFLLALAEPFSTGPLLRPFFWMPFWGRRFYSGSDGLSLDSYGVPDEGLQREIRAVRKSWETSIDPAGGYGWVLSHTAAV
jgi:hypothetical protein